MYNKNGLEKDIKNTLSIKEKRLKAIENTSADDLPKSYAVNELAKSLHPNGTLAVVKKIKNCTYNSKIIVLESTIGKFPYFRAGTFVTLSLKINGIVQTRPYSIFSSPNQALKGILELGIQSAGDFSSFVTSKMKTGTKVIVGEPSGDFCYDNLRDNKNIFAIAGGSGITPFISMAKSIMEGSDDFNLTIIYGVKTRKDMMINPKDFKDPRIKIITILNNEQVDGFEHGFITSDVIKKHMPKDASIFVCGPNVMYRFIALELKKLGIKYARYEHNCIGDLSTDKTREFNLTVHIRDEVFKIKAKENETLLNAMEKEGLLIPSKCRSGFCGFCHSRVIKGNYIAPEEYEHRRLADIKFNYIHPCATYPTSDMEIEVPIFNELEEL